MRPCGFALLLALALPACSVEPSRPVSGTSKHEVVLSGVKVDRFEGDRIRYRATLRELRLDRIDGRVRGAALTVDVLGDEGETAPRARLFAPEASTRLGSDTIELGGGVRIVDAEARVLSSERMRYTGSDGRLVTEAPVTLEGENFRARGRALGATKDSRVVEVLGPIEARAVAAEP